ncbi:hypothetical protein [Riemerella anatipestifer]|uniref:hypothetical protein n=1 Tax=Riemerella anatipestifer TaxID=34085 RepID=UPI0021D5D964|nr:hypothetical protein [Riemerella anatipestifer]
MNASIKIWEAITDVEIYKSKKLGWMNLNSAYIDGNPILVYYNHEEKRGIRVIQQDSFEETNHPFATWIDYFGDEQSFHGNELVVSSKLTEENIERYKKVISLWLNNRGISNEEIEKIY